MPSLYLKIITPRGKIRKYTSNTSPRRIYSQIEANNFQKAYVKVSYGKKKCIDGCMCEFHNDGWYANKQELNQAVKTFWSEK